MSHRRSYRAVIVSPGGDEFDLSSGRLLLDQLGSIESSTTEDLAVLTHDNLRIGILDDDGAVEAFLTGAAPADDFQFILERENGDQTWTRVFGGVLDIATSIEYDDNENTVSLTVFSYSKSLERRPATAVGRTMELKTASITGGTRNLTFIAGETDDLLPGDVVVLTNPTDATDTETFVVDRISSSTVAVTVDPSSATKNSFYALVTTPWYRYKTPAFIAAAIAAEGGAELDGTGFDVPLAEYPIASSISLVGGSFAQRPSALSPDGTTVIATFPPGRYTKRRVMAGPLDGWTDGATSNLPLGDWTPYFLTKPATVAARSEEGDFDDGRSVNSYFFGSQLIAGGAWDHLGSTLGGTPCIYGNRNENLGGAGGFNNVLRLYRNGGSVGGPSNSVWYNVLTGTPVMVGCEFEPTFNLVWGSYRDTPNGVHAIKYWDFGAASFVTVSTAIAGQLRCCIPMNRMVCADEISGNLVFFNISSTSVAETITPPEGTPLLWTFRAWGSWFAYMLLRDDGTYIAIHDRATFALLAAYKVSPFRSFVADTSAYLTVHTDAFGVQRGIANVGAQWFVLDERFAGVVPLADFSGDSCAAAARELAVILNSIVRVDEFKTMSFLNRQALTATESTGDLGTPITRRRRPVAETYRASVKVNGTTETGDDFSVIVGDEGASASRLEFDSKLAQSAGVASAAALSSLAFVSKVREQVDVTVFDDDAPLESFTRVTVQEREYIVYKKNTSLATQIHTLTLIGLPR